MSCEIGREIQLSSGAVAFVDECDFNWVSRFTWHQAKSANTSYAFRTDGGKTIYLHREVSRIPDGLMVDHKNRNGLDCRSVNLRACTNRQNQGNTGKRRDGHSSRFKGVCFDKRSRKYYAYIYQNGRQVSLGRYKDEESAARAYDVAAIKHFGEFALLNEAIHA